MKKLIFSMFIVLAFISNVFAEMTIRITNGEWEPYLSRYCYENGFASHIVVEAFKMEGIKVEWGFFPWKRSYVMAEAGKNFDASAVWWPTDEVKEAFLISEPVINTSFVFFCLKDSQFANFEWNTMEDLKNFKIGFTNGYDYGKELMAAKAKEKLKIEDAPSDEMNFKKLKAKRFDIFPNDPIVGYSQLRSNFPPENVKLFTHNPKEFEKNTLNLIISKKCKNASLFLEKFNSGLKKLSDSGKLDQMKKDLDAGKYYKQKEIWKR